MTDKAEQIAEGLTEVQRLEDARRFLNQQLDKQGAVLAPEQYYRCWASLVAAIPPFKRPKFHVRKVQP